MLKETLENPLDSKINPVNPKWNQPLKFTGRTDAEAPILWAPDVKSWFIGKDSDAGKHWRYVENGTTEDKMVGWHHQFNGHEFEHLFFSRSVCPTLCDPMGCSLPGFPVLQTLVWASSMRWWRVEKPGVLQSMGSQTVEHDWVTAQQQQCMMLSCSILNNKFQK